MHIKMAYNLFTKKEFLRCSKTYIAQKLVRNFAFGAEVLNLQSHSFLCLGIKCWVDNQAVDKYPKVIPYLMLFHLNTTLVFLFNNFHQVFDNHFSYVVHMTATLEIYMYTSVTHLLNFKTCIKLDSKSTRALTIWSINQPLGLLGQKHRFKSTTREKWVNTFLRLNFNPTTPLTIIPISLEYLSKNFLHSRQSL